MSDEFRSEIIENEKARIDLLKWKLLVVAAIVGWSLDKGAKGAPLLSYWALSLVPFACIFVDSHCFHINLRTFVIGHFLRLHKNNAGSLEYENFVHWLRIKNATPPEKESLRKATPHEPPEKESFRDRIQRWLNTVRDWLGIESKDTEVDLKFRVRDTFGLEQGALTLSTLFLCVSVLVWPQIALVIITPAQTGSVPTAPGSNAGLNAIIGWAANHPCECSGSLGLILSVSLWCHYNYLKRALLRDANKFKEDKAKSEEASRASNGMAGG